MCTDELRTRLRIDEAVQRVHRALIEARTRDGLASAVCRALAESDPYAFAWIGNRDPADGAIVPEAAAGDADSDPVETPAGAAADAMRTGEVRVVRRLRD